MPQAPQRAIHWKRQRVALSALAALRAPALGFAYRSGDSARLIHSRQRLWVQDGRDPGRRRTARWSPAACPPGQADQRGTDGVVLMKLISDADVAFTAFATKSAVTARLAVRQGPRSQPPRLVVPGLARPRVRSPLGVVVRKRATRAGSWYVRRPTKQHALLVATSRTSSWQAPTRVGAIGSGSYARRPRSWHPQRSPDSRSSEARWLRSHAPDCGGRSGGLSGQRRIVATITPV